ncbi:MAG: preprotein translocase subunit SecE [Lachnospiraceae bacterium]|nr:preprotein translocase subunit SecE [Lachnospiraceae bacterium]
MADNNKNEASKPSWFKQVKAEFKKIIWPDKKKVTRQTIAVVIISVILGGFIALVDLVVKAGLGLIL